MQLTLQDWGAIAQIAGGGAVVVTLGYLGVQLRQAARSIRSTTMQIGADFNGQAFQELISNPEFVSLYLKANELGLDALDANDRFRFVLFCNKCMRYFEHMYFLHRDDALPAGFWDGQAHAAQDFVADKGSGAAWELNKHMFSLEFRRFVDGLPRDRSGSILTRGH